MADDFIKELLESDPGPKKEAEPITWVRRKIGGQRAQVVLDGGRQKVRVLVNGKPSEPRDYDPFEWEEDYPERGLNPSQVDRITYIADQELRECLGDYGNKKDWLSMDHKARRRWGVEGPGPNSESRRQLFLAIRAALKRFVHE